MSRCGLRVAINTLTTTSRKAGVGEYIAGLVQTLPALAPDWTFLIFTARDNRHFFRLDAPNVVEVPVALRHEPFWVMRLLYILWQQFVFPRLLARHAVDVVHYPNTMLVRRGGIPSVITIHDLAELQLPVFSALRRWYRRRAARHSVHSCQRIIAVSEHARQELIERLGSDPARVVTTYEGWSPRFRRAEPDAVDALRRVMGLGSHPFVLFVGTQHVNKNLPRLIRAVALARQRLPDLRLALVGKRGNSHADIEAALSETEAAAWVVQRGYAPEDEVPVWYSAATVVAIPSLYEGFGLPVLEAQSVGTPLIAARATSLPEVVGEGGLLVDPLDVAAWAAALVQVTTDEPLRARLVTAGYANLARFDAKAIGRRVLEVYRAAATDLTR